MAMNDKVGDRRDRVFIPFNQRLLAVSLGLLISGLAHGAAEEELGEDCRIPPGEGMATVQGECAPVGAAGGKSPVYQDLRPVDAVPVEQPGPPDTIKNTEPPATKKGKSRAVIKGREAEREGGAGSGSGNAFVDDPVREESKPNPAKRVEDGADSTGLHDVKSNARGEGQKVDGGGDGSVPNGRLAVDGGALQLDSTTAEPEETELFNMDIETAEPDDELPSAAERDLFNLGYASNRTSDDYEAHTSSFSYRNHRREWFWPWQESSARGIDWGVDFERTEGDAGTTDFTAVHGQGTLGFYLTRGSYLQAQLGRHTLETDVDERTITSRHVTAMFGLKGNFSVQLETGRDFIYTGGSVTGGITRQLTSLDHTASFRWRPQERVRIQGQAGYRKYDEPDEENIARHGDLAALYGINPGWPWVWAGIGAEVLRYDEEVPDYWSPNRFTAYGLRMESSFPLYKRLSGSAAANLNRQSENGADGYGYEVRGGFQYRLFGQLYARLDMSKSKSLQQSSTWKADNITFSISGPLF